MLIEEMDETCGKHQRLHGIASAELASAYCMCRGVTIEGPGDGVSVGHPELLISLPNGGEGHELPDIKFIIYIGRSIARLIGRVEVAIFAEACCK